VNVPGALLYMGDGEIAGTAIIPLRARLQVSLVKRQKINWRCFENDDAIMSVGA
jgi:acetamidase/formamidase